MSEVPKKLTPLQAFDKMVEEMERMSKHIERMRLPSAIGNAAYACSIVEGLLRSEILAILKIPKKHQKKASVLIEHMGAGHIRDKYKKIYTDALTLKEKTILNEALRKIEAAQKIRNDLIHTPNVLQFDDKNKEFYVAHKKIGDKKSFRTSLNDVEESSYKCIEYCREGLRKLVELDEIEEKRNKLTKAKKKSFKKSNSLQK